MTVNLKKTNVSTDAAASADPAQGARQTGSVQKAIRLLDLIVSEGPFRFAELEEQSALPKATLHRMLNELIQERLVLLDERALTYSSGYRLLELANRVWTRSDIRVLARDQLIALSALSGETVQLAVHADTDTVVIDHVESVESVRLSISVGNRAPIYCTGNGKVLLAWCDAKHQASIISRISFARYTPNTITSLTALKKELEQISERGYALDNEEHFVGATSVAAPIVDQAGQAIAGISITAPTFRTDKEAILEWKDALIAAAAEVSRRLAPNAGHSQINSH